MPVHAVVRSSQLPTRFTGRVIAIGRAEHLHWRWCKDFSIYLLGSHIILPRFQNSTLNPKWELIKIAQGRARANFRRSYRRRRPIVIPKITFSFGVLFLYPLVRLYASRAPRCHSSGLCRNVRLSPETQHRHYEHRRFCPPSSPIRAASQCRTNRYSAAGRES